MSEQDANLEKTTALQLIRQAIRSRNLRRLAEGMERPWARDVVKGQGKYAVFRVALEGMQKEERKKAFQWTWDCYHPMMSDLGKALQDIDGYQKHF